MVRNRNIHIVDGKTYSKVNKYVPKIPNIPKNYNIHITIIGVGNAGISSMNTAISMGYKNINLILLCKKNQKLSRH